MAKEKKNWGFDMGESFDDELLSRSFDLNLLHIFGCFFLSSSCLTQKNSREDKQFLRLRSGILRYLRCGEKIR